MRHNDCVIIASFLVRFTFGYTESEESKHHCDFILGCQKVIHDNTSEDRVILGITVKAAWSGNRNWPFFSFQFNSKDTSSYRIYKTPVPN